MLRGRRNRRRIDQAAVRAAAFSLTRQALKVLGTLALLAAVGAGAVWGTGWARDWLTTSSTFAIDHIRFEGLSQARETELLKLAEIELGDNIFQLDAEAAERAIAAHPWVRKAAIDRLYPRGLTIRVIEYVPAALAELGGLYYVDADGKAFKKLAAGETADLPILTGITRDEYVASGDEVEALFREALAAQGAYRDAGLEARAALSEIHVDRADGLTLYCGADAVAVKAGLNDYAEKFARLDTVLAELKRRGSQAEVIRLDNRTRPGWVAVQVAQGE